MTALHYFYEYIITCLSVVKQKPTYEQFPQVGYKYLYVLYYYCYSVTIPSLTLIILWPYSAASLECVTCTIVFPF